VATKHFSIILQTDARERALQGYIRISRKAVVTFHETTSFKKGSYGFRSINDDEEERKHK